MRPVGIVLLVSTVSLYAALISYATARGRGQRRKLRRGGQGSSSRNNNNNDDPEQQQ
jgi:hypothetical protein